MMQRLLLAVTLVACGGSSTHAPSRHPSVAESGNPVGAQAPDAAEEDFSTVVQHNLDSVNGFRAQAGLPPVTLDVRLSQFALAASRELADGGPPHGHLKKHNAEIRAAVGATRLFENQGKRGGASPGIDRTTLLKNHVTQILAWMMGEGPGGPHHDTIMSANLRRIGIGIVVVGNRLTLTNDFAD